MDTLILRPKRQGETKEEYVVAMQELLDQSCEREFPDERSAPKPGGTPTLIGSTSQPKPKPGGTPSLIGSTSQPLPKSGGTPSLIGSTSQLKPTRYKKTGGAADGLGEDYECKMLTLVFLRMLSTGHEFQLASNMEAAGAFDDIVLRHRKDPDHEWDVSYVQLKHKQNKTKVIKKTELLGIAGDFSLVKYCASYQTMKTAKELQSFGNFDEHKVVIVTNASLDNSLVDVLESDPLLSTGGRVVSFKAGCEVYQELCDWVDFKEALTLLHGQLNGKNGEEVEVNIKDALEGVKYNNKAVTSWKDELLKSPTLVKLKDLLKKLAPVSDKATYSSFLAKLRVYTDQAHESQLDAMVKEQLAKVWTCGDKLEADAMLHALQSQVKSWWQKEDVYLTEDSPLWSGIVKSQTELLSKSTINGLTKFGVEFVESSLQYFHDKIDNVAGVFNLRVDSRTAASSLKVHQALAKFKGEEIFLHVNLQAFLEREADVMAAWASRWCRVLVLECDEDVEKSKAGQIASRITSLFGRKSENKLLVFIASKNHVLNDLLYHSNMYMRFNDNIVWNDLTEKTKEVVLSFIIKINGSQVTLSDIVGGHKGFVKKADLEVISQFVQGDLRFGKDLDEVGKFFVTRRLREGADGVPFVVNSVSDVRSKVVLVVAAPGMGKSTLITHLAKSAKEEDGDRRWIVHIKLSEYSKYLKEMDVEHFNEVTAWKFLEQSALSTGNSLEKLLFGVLEDKLVVFIDGVDEVCPYYEEQIFALLRFLKGLKLHQLWVASRPVFQTKLEDMLGVKTFHLVAFSEGDRTEFFNKIWKVNVPSASPEKCQEATASLLIWLTDSLGKDNPILGVPLMDAMIAETFQDRMFTTDGAYRDLKTNERLDIMSLYKTFVEKKFLRYCVEKKKTQNRELPLIRHEEENLLKQMHHNHRLAALRVMFSLKEIACLQFEGKKKFNEELTAYMKEVSEGREKMGIIDNVNDDIPHFIHRSFTEFFVAGWLAENFQKNKRCIEKILCDPGYELISDMLNHTWAENHCLHVAVLSRDLLSAKSLLDARPEPSDVNALDEVGRTPLHLAVLLSGTDPHENCVAIVKLLIRDHKARLDVADKVLGWLPLRYAERAKAWTALDILLESVYPQCIKASKGWPRPEPDAMLDAARDASLPVVRYLHEHRGGEFDCRGPNVAAMIYMAAEGGNVEMLKYFRNKGRFRDLEAVNNRDLTAFQVAALNGAYDVMAVLLELKASYQVNSKSYKNSDYKLNASLLCAAFAGSLESVKELVHKGAIHNHRDNKGHTAAWVAWHRGHVKVMDWLLTCASGDGDTPLHEACRLGEPEIVAFILSRGADIEGKGRWGRTPLMTAAEVGDLAVVTLLFEKGAIVVNRDEGGLTPLHHASSRGREQVAALLLRHQADVTIKDNAGWTPLHHASREGHEQVTALLLRHQADVTIQDNYGWTPLHHVSSRGREQVAAQLLRHHADVTIKDNAGWTPLHHASREGHEQVAAQLLRHHADVTIKDNVGWTPLHYASSKGHEQVAALLLRHHADVSIKDNCGWTPLHYASREGREKVAALLLCHHADVTIKDNHGWTPLHHASREGHEQVAALLLRHQADVTIKDNVGWTPLHYASRKGREQVAALLLRHHADVSIKDDVGWTPLHHASMEGREKVAALLLRHHADVTIKDNHGWTPLHLASREGHERVAALLLRHSADVNSINNEGRTPLDVATMWNQSGVAKLLTAAGGRRNK